MFFIIPFRLDLGRFLGRLNLVRWGVVATVGGAVGSATLFANGWLVGYLDAQIVPFEAVAEGENLIRLKVFILCLGGIVAIFSN